MIHGSDTITAALDLPTAPATVSDYSIVKRQFQIFERALKRFKDDVALWIQYIQLAKKEGARSLVGRITARYGHANRILTRSINEKAARFNSIRTHQPCMSLQRRMSLTMARQVRLGHYFSEEFDSTATALTCGKNMSGWKLGL